jgi:hypothetical protein
MHKAYRAGQQTLVTTFKEYRLPSGRKVDYLDIANGIVYELKPNNPAAIARGKAQATRYATELSSLFPGTSWNIVIDTY